MLRRALAILPLLLAALLAAPWLFTLFWSMSLESSRSSLGLHDRCAYFIHYAKEIAERREMQPIHPLAISCGPSPPAGGPFNDRPFKPAWLKSSTGSLYFVLPLWIPAALALVTLVLPSGFRHARAWYRRRFTTLCPRCGYDLRGLPPGAGSCPECAAPVTPASRPLPPPPA